MLLVHTAVDIKLFKQHTILELLHHFWLDINLALTQIPLLPMPWRFTQIGHSQCLKEYFYHQPVLFMLSFDALQVLGVFFDPHQEVACLVIYVVVAE